MKNIRINCKNSGNFYWKRDIVETAYFDDVRRYPLLSEKEELDLLYKYKHSKSDKEREIAKNKLIEGNLRFVISIARKFGTSETFPDLVNEGNIGLITAIEKFDLRKKVKLITYAISWIIAYIRRYQITVAKSVVPPNAMKLNDYVRNVTNDFFNKNERNPSSHEVAEIIKKKYNFNVVNLEDIELGKVISINETYGTENDDETFETSNIFVQKTNSNNIQDGIEKNYKKMQLNFFLNKLDNRERDIVKRYYGIDCEEETFDSISLTMDIGKERVRQICNEAIKKMNSFVDVCSDYI